MQLNTVSPSCIEKDFSRDSLFDELGLRRLRDSYMMDGETSPQERFAYVSAAFASNEAHAQRLYDYASKHYLSYSTPILAFGRNKNGLPISCYLADLPDSASGLVDCLSEVNWLSMLGGGVGLHVEIRSNDEKSVGLMPHMKVYDAAVLAYKQGTTRRGSYAAYLNVSHPDIIPFLEMRKATGDQNMRTLNLNHGVNFSDEFMKKVEARMQDATFDDSWPLIQPNNGKVAEVVSARELWIRWIETRAQTGEPFAWFIDTVNKTMPKHLKALGHVSRGSNLCTEITLPTSPTRTAVCCISSVNLEYYDEWKDDPQFLPDVLEMLDNVLEYFIQNAPDVISRAKLSAYRERSVGVGTLGFHAYLQKNHIPFASAAAKSINLQQFKHIRSQLDEANIKLAELRGPCPDAIDGGAFLRNSHVMAVAPNASSSIIMGNTSPSIEPYSANAYRQDTTSGAFINKNRFLDKLIQEESQTKQNPGMWYDDMWASIIANEGSVQHLSWMDEYTKAVYETAMEIDQRWVIHHAADRQPFIDQAQSVNLYFSPTANVKYISDVHMLAWKLGLKSLYYYRSRKLRLADKVGQRVARVRLEDEFESDQDVQSAPTFPSTECLACE